MISDNKTQSLIRLFDMLQNPYLHQKKEVRLKMENISSRVLNHWEKEKLMLSHRKTSGWRSYSIEETVWLMIVNELRTMGTPIELIRKLKTHLQKEFSFEDSFEEFKKIQSIVEEGKPGAIEKFAKSIGLQNEDVVELESIISNSNGNKGFKKVITNQLRLFIAEYIIYRTPMYLWLFKDGTYVPWKDASVELIPHKELVKLKDETYVSISIGNIMKRFLKEADPVKELPQLHMLDENECFLLETINSGEYESLKIAFKNRKMQSIELSKEEDPKKRVVDILTEGNYQTITIKQHQGRITRIDKTVKKILS